MANNPLSFGSIVFQNPDDIGGGGESLHPPFFFNDLNLGRIVDAVTADRDEYSLKPLFYTRLKSVAAIMYRQEIMHDLENPVLFISIKSFSTQMRSMRLYLAAAQNRHYKYQKEGCFLRAAEIYCKALSQLQEDLHHAVINAKGLQTFHAYLTRHTESDGFTRLRDEADSLQAILSGIRYCVLIREGTVTVRNYDSQEDYSAVIEQTFAKFRQGRVKDYRVKIPTYADMNHIEAQILDKVAELNPDAFASLEEFCTKNKGFTEPILVQFDREIQFYIAWLEYMEKFRNAGLMFCYPRISERCKEVSSHNGFDLALADKLIAKSDPARTFTTDFASKVYPFASQRPPPPVREDIPALRFVISV